MKERYPHLPRARAPTDRWSHINYCMCVRGVSSLPGVSSPSLRWSFGGHAVLWPLRRHCFVFAVCCTAYLLVMVFRQRQPSPYAFGYLILWASLMDDFVCSCCEVVNERLRVPFVAGRPNSTLACRVQFLAYPSPNADPATFRVVARPLTLNTIALTVAYS